MRIILVTFIALILLFTLAFSTYKICTLINISDENTGIITTVVAIIYLAIVVDYAVGEQLVKVINEIV